MSESAIALSELLDSDNEVVNGPTSYLIGQLAAELVTSGSDAELNRLLVTAHKRSSSSGRQGATTPRQVLMSMLSGLFQGVVADRQAPSRRGAPLTIRGLTFEGLVDDRELADPAGSPPTVRQRVLNLLAIEPRNPSSLSTEIGCSMATASRALSDLRRLGFVEDTPNSEVEDRRHRVYRLTAKGEKRQDDRFLGQLSDDPIIEGEDAVADEDDEDAGYDYGQPLAHLTQAVADLNKHDPEIAAKLYPTLDELKDQVQDPKLRAAAVSELPAFS